MRALLRPIAAALLASSALALVPAPVASPSLPLAMPISCGWAWADDLPLLPIAWVQVGPAEDDAVGCWS